MSNEKYNGWTNYETWRVNLELFDGFDGEELKGMSRYDASQYLKEMAEESIEQSVSKGLARDFAMAFLQAVDWYSIADHLIPTEEEETA